MQSEETKINKTIYISKAACGTGKTEVLVQNINQFGYERTIIATPTIELCNDIERRLKASGTKTHIKAFHSEIKAIKDPGVSVEKVVLTNMLPRFSDIPKYDDDYKGIRRKVPASIIIITISTFERLTPESIEGWTVIIDEVLGVESLNEWKVTKASHLAIENFISVDETTKQVALTIKGGVFENVVESSHSTLDSKTKALLEEIKNSPLKVIQGTSTEGYVGYRSAYLKENIKNLFEAAREVHVLGAGFSDTFFHRIFDYWGFEFKTSFLKPESTEHNNTDNIELIQLLPDGMALSKYRLTQKQNNDQTVLDKLLDATNKIFERDYLIVLNKWVKVSYPTEQNVKRMSFDSRGSNKHTESVKVALFACCNPSPMQENNLADLSVIMGVDVSILRKCWEVSYYTEMVYQQASRTSLRKRNNNEKVKVIVADEKAVDYLHKEFPEATINKDHIIEIDKLKKKEDDGRRQVKSTDARRRNSTKTALIKKLLQEKKSTSEIVRVAKCSRTTVLELKNEM